jgi:hypothetical protein
MPDAISSAYNNVMSVISEDGSSAADIKKAIDQFETIAGPQDHDIVNAMNNMKASLSDGTYSQQGSQGALAGAAQKDGLGGIVQPQINGPGGMANQMAGLYDSGSASSRATFKNPSVGANSAILQAEISGGAPSSQIKNNALALAKEAKAAGMNDVYQAAQNIAKSVDDGSYNGPASSKALASATNSDNLQSGANPVTWGSN